MRHRPGHRQSGWARGFTLMELMIVLALIAVFSGLIAGELRGTFEDARLRSTGRKLVNALSLAGSRAVTMNHPHVVTIDRSKSRFTIEARVHDEDAETGDPLLKTVTAQEGGLDARIAIEVREAAGGELDAGETGMDSSPERGNAFLETITFQADGTADGREILLRDRAGVELLLRINPATGRVRMTTPHRVP